jgi:hypothetical protein
VLQPIILPHDAPVAGSSEIVPSASFRRRRSARYSLCRSPGKKGKKLKNKNRNKKAVHVVVEEERPVQLMPLAWKKDRNKK